MSAVLPADPKERKSIPITTGVIDYFSAALAEVAIVSRVANEQHNPGQPLHWAWGKSNDHADCIVRHLVDRGSVDSDGLRHSAKVAWRALALLQEELVNEGAAPLPRAAWVDEAKDPSFEVPAVPIAEVFNEVRQQPAEAEWVPKYPKYAPYKYPAPRQG